MIVTKRDFLEVMSFSPPVCASLMQRISAQLNETEKKLPKIAYNSARKKVAEELIFLAEKYGVEKAENISFAVPRDDLSALSGISPESVSRNLGDFKEEKLIDIINGELVIVEFKKLTGIKS
jgi:CRP-like cAMP-binding protein